MGRTAWSLCLFSALTLTGWGAAFAQEFGPPLRAERLIPLDEGSEKKAHLTHSVSEAIVSLDATGHRSSEAIADSTVTLVLGELKDPMEFAVVCQSTGNDLREFVQNLAQSLSLPGTVAKPSCSGTGRDSDPFLLQFQLHYEGGGHRLFNETPMRLDFTFPNDPDAAESEDETTSEQKLDLSHPVPLGKPHTATSHASTSLPKGWSPDHLPEAIHADSAFASFDQTVSFEDGKLVTDEKLEIKAETIDLDSFLKWLPTAKLHDVVNVRLVSPSFLPWSAFLGTTTEGKKASQLMSQAIVAIGQKKFADADAKLSQAESIDPGHELLHHVKGELEEARGNLPLALTEYQEELKEFPDQKIVLGDIARLQVRIGRKDDAIVTLESWMNAIPDDLHPPVSLMNLYHEMGRDDLAVAVGDRAMTTLGDDGRSSVQFLYVYGHEQMLTGRVDGAQAALVKLLDHTTDIQFVNDAAYFLSEQGVSLDRAEEALRVSIQQLGPRDWQTEHLFNLTDKGRKSLMFASWDTLGWILFRENRIDEAESYIRAAWRNHPDAAIGRHLGELLVAKEKPAEALDAFHLALATVSTEAEAQKKAATDPDVIAIHAAIEKLEKQGQVSSIKDPAAELAKLRVLDAGPAGKRSGRQEFQVLLLGSTIIRSPSGEQEPDGTSELVQAIKLPTDFFPKGSDAQITDDARLDCKGECTLTLLP